MFSEGMLTIYVCLCYLSSFTPLPLPRLILLQTAVEQDERARREERAREAASHREKLARQRRYAQLVRELHQPAISDEKRKEVLIFSCSTSSSPPLPSLPPLPHLIKFLHFGIQSTGRGKSLVLTSFLGALALL